WFTELSIKRIGRVTTAGAAADYTLTTAGGPQFLAAGPDGGLWLTESGNRIARRSPSDPTTVVEDGTVLPATTPGGVTAGPDGNIWFTETDHGSRTARIGRIDLAKLNGCSGNSSLCVTEFPITGESSDTQLYGITTGPDGALWFTSTGKVN